VRAADAGRSAAAHRVTIASGHVGPKRWYVEEYLMNLIFIALVVISLVLLATAIFQWLWNITMPEVFGLRPIGFWVALRLLLIAGFLTSGSFVNFNFG
jgi:hypothetical protein